VNIGFGADVSVNELAQLLVAEVEYQVDLVFDSTKPDGTPKNLFDVSKINRICLESSIELSEGIT
jgi:GDP-L-fucose synthase